MRALIAVVALSLSCSTKQKAEVSEATLQDRGRRTEMLEATLRVLDDNPAYVDQLFLLTLEHPKTLDRLLGNFTATLHDEALARRTARHLANHPRGLRLVIVETLDAAERKPEAREALVTALKDRAWVASRMMGSELID